MDFGFTPYSSNILGGFKAPNAQPSGAKLTQNRQKQYFENTSLPGVSEPNAQKIIQYVNTNAKSEEEKKLLTQDLRQAGIKLEQKKAYQDERNGMKAQITSDWVNEKDPVKRSSLEQTVKLANFADVLKAKLETEGVDTDTIKDEDIVGRYVNLGQKESETFANYLNNKITSVDFGRELGLIKEEEQDQSHNIFDKVSEGDILPYANPAYKYTGTESGLEYLGGMAANVPGSAWNIVAGLGNMARNPVDTAKGLAKGISGAGANAFKWGIGKTTGETDEQINAKIYNESNPVYTFFRDNLGIDMKENEQVADSIGSFMANRYGGWEEIKKTMKEDPAGVIGDAISVLEGGVNMAGKAGLINEASKVSMLEKLNAVNPYTQIPSGATKVVGGVLKGTGKGLSNLAEATLNKITAIDKEDRVFATQNPELVNGYVNGTKTVDDIANTLYSKMDEMQNNRASLGAEYENVRNGKGVADTSAIIDNLTPNLESKQIKVNKNGDLEFGKFSKFNAPQQKAIQNAWQIIKDAQSETMLDVDSVLNIRQKMDDLINWEGKSNKVSAVDKEAESVIKSFRGAIDEQAKAIPGMVELDSKYGPALQEISTMKKDWFNTDGTLKDNALSKLKNLTNDANKSKLERLEKLMPGITQDIRALKVGVAVDTAMKGRVAQYAQQMLLGGGVVSIFANPSLIVPLVAAGVVLTPKNLIKVLQWAGQGQKEIGGIVNKIKSGMKLTSQEESIVGTVLKENQSDIEKVKGSLDLDTNTTNVSTKNNMSNTNNSNNAMKTTTKQLTSKTSDISVRKPVVTMKTPEEPLMAEARKYKTPEEFIKNQKTEGDLLFHGTDKGFTSFDEAKMSNGNQGKGIYLTDNGQHASYYSSMTTRQNQVRLDMLNMKQGGDIPATPDFRVGDIMTVRVKKGANIKQLDYVPTEEQAQKFKEQGYDGIRFSDKLLDKAEDRNTKLDIKNPKEANTTVIFNKDVLSLDKTAKQIREEANKSKGLSNLKPMEAKASNPVVQMKTPEEPLMIEARKYKSAEEFMENGIKKADEIGTKEFGAKDFKGGQIKIYHQTNGEFEVFDKDIPTYFNTKKRLSTYGRNTIEGVIDIKKPLNMGTEIRTQTEQPLKIEKARKKGYDAITFTHYFDDDTTISQIIAIKPLESVKTKSQLKQIREEANKKKPLQPNK